MNDYNSDFYNNNMDGNIPPKNPEQHPADPQVFSGSQADSATETGQTPYFNRLHEEKAPEHNPYAHESQETESTYHYSYVKQPEHDSYHQQEQSYDYSRQAACTYEPNPSRKKRKKGGRGRYAAKLIASALVFGLVAGAAFNGFNYVYYKINPAADPSKNVLQSTNTLNISGDTLSTTTDLSTMVENVMPSIVSITSIVEQQYNYGFFGSGTQEAEGAGSGIIIGQNDDELLIVTNYHVIEDAKSISVGFIDENDAAATVKGYDSDADLAVVSVSLKSLSADTKSAIKVAVLGKSSSLKVGEPAVAIGNALGYGQSVTAGYVSALDREVALTDKTMTLLQTDAAINPGNSGGALLNIKGEVIGINTVKYSDTTVEGMGYAIPIDTAAPIITALMNKEVIPESEQAYLGITGMNITESYSQQLNIPAGIYVREVQENSPADKAGVHAGDVITKFNGNSISSMENLITKLESYRAGDEITLSVKRMTNYGQYEETELSITLGAKSDAK